MPLFISHPFLCPHFECLRVGRVFMTLGDMVIVTQDKGCNTGSKSGHIEDCDIL